MTAYVPRRLEALRQLFRSRRMFRWAACLAGLLALTALLADGLANDKPLYCQYRGDHYFPAFSAYGVGLGLTRWPEEFHREDWLKRDYDRVLFAPIPYSPGYLDLGNTRFRGPFDAQAIPSWRYRHWLGTDQLGRDVLAALIHGTRAALLVGLLGTLLALLIAIPAGGLLGFYSDDRLQGGILSILAGIMVLLLGLFYLREGWQHLHAADSVWARPLLFLAGGAGAIGLSIAVAWRLARRLEQRRGWRTWHLPADLLGMRLVEAIQAMPGMLLLLALIPLFLKPSVWNVVLITGLIRWPGMARFVRAEMLRIRNLPYIEAARLAGIPDRRLWWRHALPNALPPILVLIPFSIASGVLLEAFLSFLGLGLPPDQLSWGGLLSLARRQFDAWWLAVFPGLAIFLTITAFHLLGEALQEWLDGRQPYRPRSSEAGSAHSLGKEV